MSCTDLLMSKNFECKGLHELTTFKACWTPPFSFIFIYHSISNFKVELGSSLLANFNKSSASCIFECSYGISIKFIKWVWINELIVNLYFAGYIHFQTFSNINPIIRSRTEEYLIVYGYLIRITDYGLLVTDSKLIKR
jgi:hypothetical protein